MELFLQILIATLIFTSGCYCFFRALLRANDRNLVETFVYALIGFSFILGGIAVGLDIVVPEAFLY